VTPPTVDTCALIATTTVASALRAPVREGRHLAGNGACQYHAIGRPVTATIAERAADVRYFETYVRNAHGELAVVPQPVAGLGDRAARWPGTVVVLIHRKFALVTVIGLARPQAQDAALAIARAVASKL
jgi:hypothetical protein